MVLQIKTITVWNTPITGFIRIILYNNLNYASESILYIRLQYKVNTDDGDRRRSWYGCT